MLHKPPPGRYEASALPFVKLMPMPVNDWMLHEEFMSSPPGFSPQTCRCRDGLAKLEWMKACAAWPLANALDCGYLICLDADCTVREDYFRAIHDHFQQDIKTPGCSLHFEHVLADAPSAKT